ncbi:GmrSD restriction endonuclease domain-containing protein [Geodermatophilus sp. CPCC 205761]|uniref:GmrSD restriction endonuclease domain-containing protein n=1 Tax=Geodermatophilus sp. CPCC 205761 TaxID=2936597 RepID=UPI003EED2617
MTGRPVRVVRWAAVAVVLLFVVGGLAASGLPGGVLMAGLAALLLGTGAAITGRARWAFIAGRKAAGLVAAAGVVALVAGAATAPPTVPTAAASRPSTPTPSAPASPTPDEAAIAAAERALAQTETDEVAAPTSAPTSVAASGLLGDQDAQAAVAGAERTSALAALAAVEVRGRAPRTGYDRDLFGSGWVDTDRNGCDTRNDVLARDLTGETVKPGTRNCVVLTGTLADPYSGRTIAFQRGQTTSDDVQVDHVVALSDSWQKGAQGWDGGRRTAFANDPLNLLAVDGPLNMQKGDGDAASWLPPARSYRCAYVARQVAVKVGYGLWMTQAEKNAIATVLSACPDEPLPRGVVAQLPAPTSPPAPAPVPAASPAPRAPVVVPAPAPAPRPAPAPAPVPAPAPAPVVPVPAPAPGPSYANCDAVRAAGAAPIRAGDPGWDQKFDRDRDGVGCE